MDPLYQVLVFKGVSYLYTYSGSCRDRQEDGANAGVILLVSEHAGADRSGDKCRVLPRASLSIGSR